MLLFSYVISGFEIPVVFSPASLEGNKYKFMLFKSTNTVCYFYVFVYVEINAFM